MSSKSEWEEMEGVLKGRSSRGRLISGNGIKINLGKGVSLKGASLNYEEQVGPIDLKVKQKVKGKPEIRVGKKLKVGRGTLDIGARKQGKDVGIGFMFRMPLGGKKKGGKVGNRT